MDHLKRHLATNDNLQDDDLRKRDSRRFRVKLAAKEHVATTLEKQWTHCNYTKSVAPCGRGN